MQHPKNIFISKNTNPNIRHLYGNFLLSEVNGQSVLKIHKASEYANCKWIVVSRLLNARKNERAYKIGEIAKQIKWTNTYLIRIAILLEF